MDSNSGTHSRRLRHNDLKFQKPLKEMYTHHLQFQNLEGMKPLGPKKRLKDKRTAESKPVFFKVISVMGWS